MEKIAFYVEANNRIGIGHIIRLKNLKKIIKNKKIIWLFSGDINIAKKILNENIYLIDRTNKEKLENKIDRILKKENIKKIFLDIANRYYLSNKKKFENLILNLKKKKYFIFSFDDPRLKICSDVSIIPYIFAEKKLVFKNTKIHKVHGKKYFFSSNYFQKYKNKKKIINTEIKKIFVFLTGYDKGNILNKIIHNFQNTKYKLNIYSNNIKLNKNFKNIKILRFSENLAKYFFESDISIVGEGLSRYETATIGVPTIMIYSFETLSKKNDLAWKFINLGTGKLFKEKLDINNLREFVENKMTYTERKKMFNNAKKNFDLYGQDRMLKDIKNFL